MHKINKDLDINSETFLKIISKKFDVKLIFHLDLSFMNLLKIPPINNCINLKVINLSNNTIKYTKELEDNNSLVYIDLSHNIVEEIPKIKSINILKMKLEYNNIPNNLNIEYLKRVKYLSFLDINNKGKNKIVEINNYRNMIFQILPNLKVLDYIKKDITNEGLNLKIIKKDNKVFDEITKFKSYNSDVNNNLHITNIKNIISENNTTKINNNNNYITDIENIAISIEEKYNKIKKLF